MKLNNKQIEHNTYYSKLYYENLVKRIKSYEEDNEREKRKDAHKCKTCFYLKRYGVLQAFTSYQCKNCGEIYEHNNSGVPNYCLKCAEKHNICVDCGGTI